MVYSLQTSFPHISKNNFKERYNYFYSVDEEILREIK